MSSGRYLSAAGKAGGAAHHTTNSHTSNHNNSSQTTMIGVNEDVFLQAFDQTPTLNNFTQKKLENEFSRVISVISNQSADWDSRVQAMKHFRSLMNSGMANLDDFHTTHLKALEIPFQNNICDLRSQVVRETCITIAFLSCRLQQKFSRMAEILLPSLIKLIPNSAKIVSTSALVAIRFIIQSTHHSKFIPIIKYQLSTSKSKDIHKALCEIVERIVTLWQPATLERQLNDLQEVIRLGVCDSDEMARQYARRSFNIFAGHFGEAADRLFNSLDQQRQRMLNNLNSGGGSTLSINGYGGSTSSNLNMVGQTAHPTIHTNISAASHINSSSQHSNISGPTSLGNSRIKSTFNGNGTALASIQASTASPSRIRAPTARSTSAIDVSAQKRARARAVYLSSMYNRPRQLGSPSKPATASSYQSHLPPSTASVLSTNQVTMSPAGDNNHSSSPSSSSNTSTHSQNQTTIQNSVYGTPLSCTLQPSKQQSPPTQIPVQTRQSPQQLPQPTPQQVAQTPTVASEPLNGVALTKAASYLTSVLKGDGITENQIVTAIKYFTALVGKHSSEIVKETLSEIMPPLVVGCDNEAICVRKASVFALVAIHSKVGMSEMEAYLTSLTLTQKKLIEVYIKKNGTF